MFHIVLVEPQIPPNTGNIARLCAALQCCLHLVKPLGFSTDDRYLKRAGLDYWEHVKLEYHESLEGLIANYPKNNFYFFSKKSNQSYLNISFQGDDFIVFGSETKGLSDEVLLKYWDKVYTIPMAGPVRSLNLSSAAAMVVGEAIRQIRRS